MKMAGSCLEAQHVPNPHYSLAMGVSSAELGSLMGCL